MRKYSELSRENAAKFRAVLEHGVWRGWDKINAILNGLDCYEFDGTVNYVCEFGEKYLSEMLPPDFDRTLLKGACTAEFAQKIIVANECSYGQYGVVSKNGGHLYTLVEAPQQE